MNEIVAVAGPSAGVYLSCDGVVCAAKRRQQRLRRFKGPWASALEAKVLNKPPTVAKWDQNALTPGSAFMATLATVLTAEGARLQAKLGIPVIVSTTEEPGEGEHKLLAYMRQVKPRSCMIYGLDADLILLSMLLGADTDADVYLLREAQEFEKGSGGWRTLTISGLTTALGLETKGQIRDFVATMSLLGNDFLPRSLTHTVRDDGIPNLIACLKKVGLPIVDADGKLSRDGLLALLQLWASTEERDLVVAATEAVKTSRRPAGIGASPDETALREWNAQPARWASSTKILDPMRPTSLHKDWVAIYQSWHPGSAAGFIQGVAWVWDYYSGRPVDQSWMFDEHLPPRWSEMVTSLKAQPDSLSPPPILYSEPLPDWLHLLSVLPADSVQRLCTPKARELMMRAPYFWPTSWSVYDVGKTQLWECEPVIPMIPETVLRSWH